MKKYLLLFFILFISIYVYAQVPYFAETVGNNHLYGYTSLKIRPGISALETYTNFQFGLGKSFAFGVDLYTNNNDVEYGFVARYGTIISSWFNIGLMIIPSLNLEQGMNFSYLTTALLMNGNIAKNVNLFWCSNTWYNLTTELKHTLSQWTYFGYTFSFKNKTSLTPMLGEIHSWFFDQSMDMAFGFYYSVKSFNIYLWGDQFFKKNMRIVIGIDFKF